MMISMLAMGLVCGFGVTCLPAAAATDFGPGDPYLGEAAAMSGVTLSMLQAESWTDSPEYRQVKMTRADIEAFNAANFSTESTNMHLLKEMPDTFDGIDLRTGLAGFSDPKNLYLNGAPVPASYYAAIRSNIAAAHAENPMNVGYGIIINRTTMKSMPYPKNDFLSDSLDDPEWDNLALSALLVNEPVLVYLQSADRRFYYVRSEICDGWVPAEDLVLCHSKEEWLSATEHKNFLVVTGETVTTEPSSADPEHSKKDLDMGTVLELAVNEAGLSAAAAGTGTAAAAQGGTAGGQSSNRQTAEFVDDRMSWYNYVVYVPARGADGMYEARKMLIPVNRDVHIGYLIFSEEKLIQQAFKCLGNRYGWGGMLDSQDCSAYVREVYLCFGMKLPRNTTWQGNMPVKVIDLSELSDQEKADKVAALPPGTILQFPGHEMIYLGMKGGEFYAINDVSSLILAAGEENVRYRARGVIINSLNQTLRGNGRSWLSNLTKAIVPFEK